MTNTSPNMFNDGISEGISFKKADMANQIRLMNKVQAGIVDEIVTIKDRGSDDYLTSLTTDNETAEGCSVFAVDRKAKVVLEQYSGRNNTVTIEGLIADGATDFRRISFLVLNLGDDAEADKVIHAVGFALGECIATLQPTTI